MYQGLPRWSFFFILLIFQGFVSVAGRNPYFRMPFQANPDNMVPGVIIFKMKPEAYDFRQKQDEYSRLWVVLNEVKAGNPQKVFPFHKSPERILSGRGEPLVDLSLIYEVRIQDHALLEETINRLWSTGLVEYAQPRYIPSLLYSPDDPMAVSQYYLETIQAFDAWDISRGDSSIVIGITDTGTDLLHPDLVNAISYNYNDTIDGNDTDNDGFPDNFHGWNLEANSNDPQYVANPHGVHVSGIAAGSADNGTGIAGVGFNSRILPVKIDDELGRLTKAYEGIVYAADQGASIINCSWGGTLGAGQFGQDIVNYAAVNCDAVVVAAAGNSNNQVPFFPASYDNAVSVAATTIDDEKWVDSSYGIFVDIAAPGANILSTWPAGNYIPSSGTSMASPVVAGAAAILREHFPDYSAAQIAAQLMVTSDIIDTLEANSEFQGLLGTGRLNLYRALSETNHPFFRLKEHLNTDDELAALNPGVTFELASRFQNLLAQADGVSVHLSAESEYVNIENSIVDLGQVGTNEIVDNSPDPFVITLSEDIPASCQVVFTVTFTTLSGKFAGQQRFSILFNVDYVNVHVNDIATTITSKGTAGYNYPDFSQGNGFTYQGGFSLIKNAGLIIGAGSTQVVDNIYGPSEGSYNSCFVSVQNAHFSEEPYPAQTRVSGLFNDSASELPLGLEVGYSALFWHDEPHTKYLILEYELVNISQEAYNSLYAGFFVDWVLRDNKNHRATFDVVSRMGYAWSAQGGFYSALGLLTDGGIRHYAFDNKGFNGSINIDDGFTGLEKYTALRTNRVNAGVYDPDNDISTLISTGPFYMEPGDSLTVAFVLLAGDHLADIRQSAQNAYHKYHDDANNVANMVIPELNFFPNPSADNLMIDITSPGNEELILRINDINGATLVTQVMDSSSGKTIKHNVDISGIKPGTYIIELKGSNFHVSRVFLKI